MGNGINNETLVELLVDSNNSTVNHSEFVSIGFTADSVAAMLDTIKIKNIPIHMDRLKLLVRNFSVSKIQMVLMFSFFSKNNACYALLFLAQLYVDIYPIPWLY